MVDFKQLSYSSIKFVRNFFLPLYKFMDLFLVESFYVEVSQRIVKWICVFELCLEPRINPDCCCADFRLRRLEALHPDFNPRSCESVRHVFYFSAPLPVKSYWVAGPVPINFVFKKH